MKRLTKKQIADQKEIADKLRTAITDYEEALNTVNEAIAEARDFRDEVVAAMDEYMGERSEKWPETESGEQYIAWHDEWEQLTLDDVEATVEADADAFSDLNPEPGFA